MRIFRLVTAFLLLASSSQLYAQFPMNGPMPGERVDVDTAMKRALAKSSLTVDGKPFHAILNIGAAGSPYTGQVEVWWKAPDKYKSVIQSPTYNQIRIVNGSQISEKNTGDYYPRWLENFVDAILDPVPMAGNFRGHGGVTVIGPQITRGCVSRDDRPGGITDQLTWGMVCFSGADPLLTSVLTTNYNVDFEDWQSFGKKNIARTYKTSVLDYKEIVAHLTTLEDLKNTSDQFFAITSPTPLDQQIKTVFVSTAKEESLMENSPVIDWPPVREGKTDGYMIVYARTDRTGQVRETAKHNSDQPGLETFGMQEALHYKFKPLIVDGVPQQMEMPLVLHFTSKIADPLPVLTGEELLKKIKGCPAEIVATVPANAKATRISVNEQGKITGETYTDAVNPGLPAVLIKPTRILFLDCQFLPLVRNGVVTYYHGDAYVQKSGVTPQQLLQH